MADSILNYFKGVAAKRLSDVEIHPKKSNQHEFNGTRELRKVIRTTETFQFPTKFIWMGEENEGIVVLSTWLAVGRRNLPSLQIYYQGQSQCLVP